jgi:hypothetical protein
MPEQLTEHVEDWRNNVVVEASSRTIRNVALAGPESKNGYRYAEAALQAATPLYENVPVFLDHPVSPLRPRARSTRDLAGTVTNARYEGGRIRGDLRLVDTEAGRTLLALAEADGPGVGMSHVVLAERNGDGSLVERIVEVVSVDAVAFPASTRTFRESTAERRATTRIERVKRMMKASSEGRAIGTIRPGRLGSAERAASSSGAERSAPSLHPPRSGSLERLLASVDARLPGHLRRLAAAPGDLGRGRGARVGVFPRHIVVEWRTALGVPVHYALTWRLKENELVFGDTLLPLEAVAERLGSWSDRVPSAEPERPRSTTIHRRLEQLEEQMRQIVAEQNRRGKQSTRCGPMSLLRRPQTSSRIADDVFVRAVRRR